MKIVADDKIPFLKGVFEPFAEVVYLPGDRISAAALKNADAILTRSITKCNEELLKNTTVKFIGSATIGDDHIDKAYCYDNSIQWTTAKGCNSSAVEQYVITALLHLSECNNFQLKNKTIGIIGVGNIGSRVAKAAELLGMNVLLNDPPRASVEDDNMFVALEEIYEKADIITIHVPLSKTGKDKTYHLANDDFFKKVKKDVIVINSSRGAVVDSDALKNAISSGKVKHTVIDVWENEPDIDLALMKLTDIATPHIAGYSLNGKLNGTRMTVQAVSKYLNLGLDNWLPEIAIQRNSIEIDGKGLSDQEIMNKIFGNVYSIQNDDIALRNNINDFEKLRRDYLFRNENDSFDLVLKNVRSETIYLLKSMGFKIQKTINKI